MADCQDYPTQPRRPQKKGMHDSGDNTTESISLKELAPSGQEMNNTFNFYLLILQEKVVEQAYIHLGPDDCDGHKLERIDGQPNLWKCSLSLRGDPIEERLGYKYGFYRKKYSLTVRVTGKRMGYGKDPSYCKESDKRYVSSQIMLDVFILPEDQLPRKETISMSVFFYLKWFLPLVSSLSICETLTQIKNLKFDLLQKHHVKSCISWIVEHALDTSATNQQRLYLCIVLGHLNRFFSSLPLSSSNNIAEACDRLLDCLKDCVYPKFLSAPDLELLRKIAVLLVEYSRRPGWLTFAAYFYPYLEIQFILEDESAGRLYHRYDDKEYNLMVDLLLSNVKIESRDDQIPHQDLLHLALKAAPTWDCAIKGFTCPEVKKFFENDDEKTDFFIKFYKSNFKDAKIQNKSSGERLVEFSKIPNNIRAKMQEFLFPILLEFSKSDEELKDERVDIFLTSNILEDLDMDQVLQILLALSKSNASPRQDLLLDILDKESFRENWQQTSLTDKVNVCKSWIITRVVNNGWGKRPSSVDKIVAVYGAIDAIMKRSFNSSDKALVEEVSSVVMKTMLKNEDAKNVLKAFPNIEEFVTPVQDFYKGYVKKKIEQMPNVVKKSGNIVKEFPSTRFGQELLTCILEIVDVPEVAKGCEINEDDFQKVLDWSEIWITLFKTTGTIEKNKKYQAGKKICQHLTTCIEKCDVSINFVEVLEQNKEKVSMLCAYVRNKSRPQAIAANLKWEILDGISILKAGVEKCFKEFDLLESAINFGKKISNDVYPVDGIATIIETFNDLKESRRSRKVNEVQADTFWGILSPLLRPAEDLQPLMNSLSFMALTKKCLNELASSRADEAASFIKDFCSLIVFLKTRSIEELQAQWNPVLHNPGSLSVETMKALLGTLRRQNRLDEELELLATYFGREFSPMVKIYIEDYVKYPDVLEQVRQVIDILGIFELANPSNEFVQVLLQFQTILENSDKLTLQSLHKSMEEVKQIASSFSGKDMDNLIEELSRSSALLGFIKDIVDEDIRFLIDAVEEHSDQFVSESSVSELIDVHGFLAPLIKTRNQKKCDPRDFLMTLKESCSAHKSIELKIQHCSTNVNSLRGLYTSIANRGEITKEIIVNCLNKGEYWVSQKHGKCEAKMSYVLQESGEKTIRNYSLSDLHDIRSRAHLINTSHKNALKIPPSHTDKSSEDIDFDDFIHQVNLLTEICTLLLKLHPSGYVKYREFCKPIKSTSNLQTTKNSLQNDLENWENVLRSAREEFYLLNYFRSDQLCTLYDFLMNQYNVNCEEVLSLIHFVDRTITKEKLEQYQELYKELRESNLEEGPELLLSTVGKALDNIFRNSERIIRLIPDADDSQPHSKLETTVTPGKIFIASLEQESPLTANVIVALYKNTSNAYPEPHQVIFCSSETTWEELHLLLERCFAPSKRFHYESLFCIANVELLPNELQFSLVDAIKKKQEFYESPQAIKENAAYQLALICRGGNHHHVAEQFAQFSHHIAGMTDIALRDRFTSSWPNIKTITSKLPGLGKTEQIKREAMKNSMNVATFSISGPFEPRKLIQRLKELKLKKYHCLHLDVGEVSDPLLLDTFIFQLIVTGMVSAGNQFYHLPTKHIYIEIANTLNDRLRESLVVSKYFTRSHLQWQNYTDLLVSTEITSNVQVVCQYLNIYDRACIDSKEIHFVGPQKIEPLSTQRCQELLDKYFSSDADITFTTLHIFLRVLAKQLLKFSMSAFFKIRYLKSMRGDKARGVRYNLFRAFLKVSKEFASRAITTCPSSDTRVLSLKESSKHLECTIDLTPKCAKDMVERAKGMIQWEDSNHLLVVFHGINSQSITAMYRTKTLVPHSVEELLKSQSVKEKKELEDFKVFTQEQLQEKLEKIACMKVVRKSNLFPSYALTPDNILKMILIILRVRVNTPVIIMGETGCGKTSLVRYLANTCGVQFHKFNFHAGISENEIIVFIKEKESHARNTREQIWIFLDEINTCDHLGLISDIMCHHSLLGRPLSQNLVFLAACNPYKQRPEEHIKTAGLKGKNITDAYSGLVYRVHALPEAMIDYVWDYGSLGPQDERDYIRRMVRDLSKDYEGILVDVLVGSQQFIRDAEKNSFCVSLRDVHRCIRLVSWFFEITKKRQELKSDNYKCHSHLQKYLNMSKRFNDKPMIKSIVLALAHCYLSRLPTAEQRRCYRERMVKMFERNGTIMEFNENLDSFMAIVRMEEEDYLDRMELPPGTARNARIG